MAMWQRTGDVRPVGRLPKNVPDEMGVILLRHPMQRIWRLGFPDMLARETGTMLRVNWKHGYREYER